jgi:hypothetical protein
MEADGLLLYSHNPATNPYPEPDESNPNAATYFLKIHFNTALPSTCRSSSGLNHSNFLN